MAVLSREIYSPFEFIETLTGKYHYIGCYPTKDIHNILVQEGIENNVDNTIWDYPLDEIEEIVENDINVVLVDVTGIDKDGRWIKECRWFEVPEEYCANFKNFDEV